MMPTKFLNALFLIALFSHCGNYSGRGVNEKKPDFYEGVVRFSFQLVDGSTHFSQKDSILFNTTRNMYLYKNTLIDITQNAVFKEDHFIRNDTNAYVFYNFSKQRFIEFRRLSRNVEVLKKGTIDEIGQFSKLKVFDPLYDMADSAFQTTDTVISGRSVQKLQLKIDPTITDKETLKYANLVKVWIDPQIKDFPLQMSYSLSKKRNNGFVYQRELPMGDGNGQAILKLDYEPRKLPDSLVSIFKMLIEKSPF